LTEIKAFAKRGYEFHFQFTVCDLEMDQITCGWSYYRGCE